MGGHYYKIVFADDYNTEELLMSSRPFLQPNVNEGDCHDLLFTMTINDEWLAEHTGREIGQFDCGGCNHGVYILEDGSYLIEVSDTCNTKCCIMQINSGFSSAIVRLNGNQRQRLFGLNNALMMTYAFAGSLHATLLMHASVVRKDGYGYLCLGVSGTGKSTHTGLWLKYIPDTDLMNDDTPVVRVCNDGVVRVYGSPWSGKTPCYRDVEAPVGAFLQLRQAPYNKIRKQTVIEGLASLLPSCSVMKWDKQNHEATCLAVSKILERTSTYVLECLPDEDAARLSYSTIKQK